MTKRTSPEALDDLHALLADTLASKIKEASAPAGEDGESKGLASLLNVARQFLKDNDCTVSGDKAGERLAPITQTLPFTVVDDPNSTGYIPRKFN